MNNVKISELNSLSSADSEDLLPIVDVSANETKKISVNDIIPNIPNVNNSYSESVDDTYSCSLVNSMETSLDTKISNLSKNLLPMPNFFSVTTYINVPIELPAGTYTLSGTINGNDMDIPCLFQFAKSDGTSESVYINKGFEQSVTFTTSTSIVGLTIYSNSYYSDSLNRNSNYYNIQIEDGSNATEYVEYNNRGVVSSGSNANGDYIYYADGTLICTKSVSGTAKITSTWGSLYDTGNNPVNFGSWAKTFIEKPKISIQFIGGNGQWFEGIADSSAAQIGNVTLASATSKTSNIYYDVIGIGRWRPYTYQELS